MTKFEGSCGFDHIYWKILNGKLHFLYSDVCVRIKTIPRKFLFADPILRFLSYLPVTFVNVLKSRLIFFLFFCFWMFVNKLFIHLTSAYPKHKRCFNVKYVKSALVNLQKLEQLWMQNVQCLLFVFKQSYICYYIIWITVPLKETWKYPTKNFL